VVGIDIDRWRTTGSKLGRVAAGHARTAAAGASALVTVRSGAVDITTSVGVTAVPVVPVFDERPRLVLLGLGGLFWLLFGFWPMWQIDIFLFAIVSAPLLALYQYSESRHGLVIRWWKIVLLLVALLLVPRHFPESVIYLAGALLLYREARVFIDVNALNGYVTAETLQARVHGAPGRRDTVVDLNALNVTVGITGERMTADLLAGEAALNPVLQVFHSLALPGSLSVDLDHAVCAGDRVLLIDTKHWKPGRYGVNAEGWLTCDGKPINEQHPASRMIDAVDRIGRHLGTDGPHVAGLIVVHSNQPGRPVVLDLPNHPKATFITADQLPAVTRDYFGNTTTINRWTIRRLFRLVRESER
jgi:hypothetical protein